MLWWPSYKVPLIGIRAHKHHVMKSYLLVKYGLTHGVVALQCPSPICKTFPINIICKERRKGQKAIKIKRWLIYLTFISFFSCATSIYLFFACILGSVQDVNSCSINSATVTFFSAFEANRGRYHQRKSYKLWFFTRLLSGQSATLCLSIVIIFHI